MTLDQYKLCPCGSGKKIKFCCSRDILSELERLDRMIQGEQRLAAVEKIDTLLAKYPDRPSLLMIKAEVELALKEFAKARETIARLESLDQMNPSVMALPAILAIVEEGNIGKAIVYLQNAFSMVDGVVTARVYEAVMLVSMSLLKASLPMAAKGHLQLALALSDAKDDRCTSALMQLNHSRSVPLMMREPLDLLEAPDDVTWRIEFQSTMDDVYRGRWLQGADSLAGMSTRILDAPAIVWNLAVLYTWLGRNAEASRTFRSFAAIREMPEDRRVFAEALSQLLEVDVSGRTVEVVHQAYPVTDSERLMEFCLSNDRLRPIQVEQSESNEPPPKAAFELLDKSLPESGAELVASQVARVVATVWIFGKQTDRDARLQVQLARAGHEAETLAFIKSWGDGLIGEMADERVVSHAARLSAELFGDWRVPDDTPPESQSKMFKQLRQQGMLEKWPQLPSPLYDNTTPLEASKESRFRIPLLAELLIMDVASQEGNWEVDFNPLRQKLNLSTREAIDSADADLNRLPIHDMIRLDIPGLSDDDLLTVYRRSYSVMAVPALRATAKELIGRPSLDEKIDKVEAYDILSDVAATTDEALEYLEKARKLATADGESPAQWLIDELEIRLLRGEVEIFTSLLKEIETRYIKEPGVGPMLMQVLSRFGLVTPDGRVMVPQRRKAAPATQTESEPAPSGVWTPEGDSTASPPAGEAKEESKIWVPGMD